MRRNALVILGSVSGVCLLLNLKSQAVTFGTPSAPALSPVSDGRAVPVTEARALRPLSPGATRPPGVAPPVAKVKRVEELEEVPTSSVIPLSALAGAGSVSAKGRMTRVGDSYDFRFGTIQVAVTLAGSRIVAVQPIQLPHKVARNVELAARAVPVLTANVIDAQSADIDVVSGATYTSEGYLRSVQSALDKISAARSAVRAGASD